MTHKMIQLNGSALTELLKSFASMVKPNYKDSFQVESSLINIECGSNWETIAL